ncbi:LOW QUALITY PROTEIN: hypothetical protein V1477_004500 [Vespula maculifrons]|uniref:Uncharacterized protein n=1 Tax=Vespula maculifrons TaxID=7453 RepID=A0ABD2CM15_VESMC
MWSLERARRALYAHIFFVQIGPIGADTEVNRNVVVGKGSSRPLRAYFFRPDRTNRSRVITHRGEPDRGRWKVLVAPCAPIFFSSRWNHTQEYRTGVIGKGSSLPIRPYFFRPDQTNRSRVITHLGEPDRGHWKGLVAPSTPIFFSSRSDQRTGPGSLERARRSLYAHIFFVQIGPHPGEPDWGRWKGLVTPTTPIFFSSRSDQREPSYNGLKGKKEKTFFFNNFFLRNYSTQEYRTGVTGKGSSRRVGPYFFRPDRTNRSRVITHPGVPDRGHWKGLVAPCTPIFISSRSNYTQENQTWVMGKGSLRPLRPYFFRPDRTNRSRVITVTKEKKHFSLTIFFSETIAPTRTGSVSLERARRDLYARIFFVQIGPIGAELLRTQEYRTGVAGKGSSLPIRPYFFRPDQTNRSRVITYLGEPDRGHWKGLVAPSTPIFFTSRSDQRTGPGSLERARRSLYAHIFFVLIGPIGADTQEYRTGVIGKGSSLPIRPYFFRPDQTNRSRVITHLGEPDRGHWKGLVAPSTPIFFSSRWDQRTGPGSLERARRSLYAHIFFVQIGPHPGEPDWGRWKGLVTPTTPIFFSSDQREPSYNGLKGKKEKTFFFNNFFLRNYSTQEYRTGVTGKGSSRRVGPYFFRPDRTNRSRVITHRGEPDRGRWKVLVAPCAPIFFSSRWNHTQEYRTGVAGKGSSLPIRPYFFRPDQTNRSRVITHPGVPDRGRWKGSSLPIRPYFFRPDQTNRSRVITYLGEPDRGHWKGLVAPSTPIFFTSRSDQRTGPGSLERARRSLYAHIFFVLIGPIGADTQEYRTGVAGKGSSLPIRPYFFRPDQTNRSRVITHPGEPERGLWKGLVAPSTPIFFSSRLDQSDQREPSYNGLKGKKEKTFFFNNFFLRNYSTQEYRTGVTGKGSSRRVGPYFFRPDRTNRSRVITHRGEPDRGRWKVLVAPCAPIFFSSRWNHTQEYRTGVAGKGSSLPIRPYFFRPDQTNRSRVITHPGVPDRGRWKGSSLPIRPYFFRPDQTNRSRVITYLGEPDRGHWKGLVAPSTPIFFTSRSDQRTGPGSLERARRSLYAHIFFVLIGPIGADTQEYRTGVAGKGSSLPIRPYFFRPDQTNRSRVITHLGERYRGHWKGLVAPSPRRTGPVSLERARRSLYAHIFFVLIGPIGADTQENQTWVMGKGSLRPLRPYFFRPDRTNRSRVITVTKEKKHFSLTIFFSETIAPTRTGSVSLERARRDLYAHIFFVQIGPIGAELLRTQEYRTGVAGKGSSLPIRPYFFRPDQTNRSRVITENGTGVIGKGSSRPLRPYFFRPDWTSRSRVITHPGEPDWGRWKGLVTPTTPIFFSSDQREPSYNGLKGKKEKTFFFNNFFLRNYSTQEYRTGVTGKGSSRRVGPYFFRPDRTNRSRVITHRGEPDRGRWKVLVAPCAPIFFSSRWNHTQEYRTGVAGKGSSLPIRPYFFRPDQTNRSRVITHPGVPDRGRWKGSSLPIRPYFFRPDQTNRSRVITYLGEPDRGHWKGLVAPSTPIFFTSRSDQRTGPGSLERARRSLYAHIFFVLIGPIGADTQEYRTGVAGKGSSLPIRPYFFRPDQTNRSRVITHLGERYRGHWKGLVAPSPRRTGPVSLERARRSLYAHIFFVLIGPIGADTQENQTWVMGKGSLRPLRPYFFRPDRTNRSRVITVTKEKKHFSLTIFFSETIAPTRTGSVSLERARRDLYAHIFFVQIGPIGAELLRTQEYRTGVAGKGSSLPIRPYFFRPDQTNRSRVITHLGERYRGHWKGLVAPCTPIFFSSRSDQ